MSDIIACFGDSIIQGYGERPQRGWVGRLKDYFESKKDHNFVYNFGFSGHTSDDLSDFIDGEWDSISRLESEDSKYFLLFGIGINDSRWEGLPEEGGIRLSDWHFGNNIKILINKIQTYKTNSAFIGLTPVDETKTEPYEEVISFKNKRIMLFNDIIKDKCKTKGMLFLDIFKIMLEDYNYKRFLYDGLHPNSTGYDFMFHIIKDFIKENKLI